MLNGPAPVVTLIDSAGSTNPNHTYTHQTILILGTMAGQTKLRSVGRKTDTFIKKKKISAQMAAKATAAATTTTEAERAPAIEDEPPDEPADGPEATASEGDEPAEAPVESSNESPDVETATTIEDACAEVSNADATPNLVGCWQLTIMGTTEAQVVSAYQMLAKWADAQQTNEVTTEGNVKGSNNNISNNPSTPTGKGGSTTTTTTGGSPSPGGRSGKGGRGSGRGGGGKGRKGKGRGPPKDKESTADATPPNTTEPTSA